MTQAVDGLYHAKNFSEDDVDFAYLVMHIGVPRLLHTMHIVFGMPAASTIYNQGVSQF